MVQPIQTRLAAKDYFQLPEYETETLIQLIDGEVVIGMPPIIKHQRLVREILFLLTTISRAKGGEAFDSPIEVYLDEHNVFEPDVLYLKAASKCIVDEKRLVGAPDLVVEILSPSTARYDKQQKFQAYEKHGVGEYWIVDPVHEVIEVWLLGTDKTFKRQGAYGAVDSFQSVILAESIRVKDIFRG